MNVCRLFFLKMITLCLCLFCRCAGDEVIRVEPDDSPEKTTAQKGRQLGGGKIVGGSVVYADDNRLTLPGIYLDHDAVFDLAITRTIKAKFHAVTDFIAATPTINVSASGKTVLSQQKQIFGFENISEDDASSETQFGELFVYGFNSDQSIVTLDIGKTRSYYDSESKRTETYKLENGKSCVFTYKAGLPSWDVSDGVFFMRVKSKITSPCGSGEQIETSLYMPPLYGDKKVFVPTRSVYTEALYFENPINKSFSRSKPSNRVWAVDQSVTFHLASGFPEKYRSVVAESLKVYNDYFFESGIFSGKDFLKLASGNESFSATKRNQNLFVWNTDLTVTYDDIASNFVTFGSGTTAQDNRSGQIYRAIITLNADAFEVLESKYQERQEAVHNFDAKEQFRVQMVTIFIHEIGHVLGLRHNFWGCIYDEPSVMDYYDPLKSPVVLGRYDKAALKYGYKKNYTIPEDDVAHFCTEALDAPAVNHLRQCKLNIPAEVPELCLMLPEQKEIQASLVGYGRHIPIVIQGGCGHSGALILDHPKRLSMPVTVH